MVRPIIQGGVGVALGAFEGGVGKVYHPHIHPGGVRAVSFGEGEVMICVLLVLLPVVNDEEGAGVKPVGALLPDHGQQGLEAQDDGLQQLRAQLVPGAQELPQGLPESLWGQLPPKVFVFAQEMPGVCLVNLQGKRGWLRLQSRM